MSIATYVLKTGSDWSVRLVEPRIGGQFDLEKRLKTSENRSTTEKNRVELGILKKNGLALSSVFKTMIATFVLCYCHHHNGLVQLLNAKAIDVTPSLNAKTFLKSKNY